MSVSELFAAGGPLMWPLLAGAILGVGLSLERALFLFSTYYPLDELEQDLERVFVEAPHAPQPSTRLSPSSPARGLDRILPMRAFRFAHSLPLLAATRFLERWDAAEEARAAAVRRAGEFWIARHERGLGALTLLGGIAPLLGLLGTVTGMMQAFQQLSLSGGQASIAQLADGIWVAMITTAFGLAIAIPAHLVHSLFESALNARIGAMNGALQWLEERRSQAQKQ